MAVRFLETSGFHCPVTRRHVPEERNPRHSAAETSELAENILAHKNKAFSLTTKYNFSFYLTTTSCDFLPVCS
jgi:hypothetical protein